MLIRPLGQNANARLAVLDALEQGALVERQRRDADLIAEVEAVRARLLALDPAGDASFRDKIASELDVLLEGLRASRRDLEQFAEDHPI